VPPGTESFLSVPISAVWGGRVSSSWSGSSFAGVLFSASLATFGASVPGDDNDRGVMIVMIL